MDEWELQWPLLSFGFKCKVYVNCELWFNAKRAKLSRKWFLYYFQNQYSSENPNTLACSLQAIYQWRYPHFFLIILIFWWKKKTKQNWKHARDQYSIHPEIMTAQVTGQTIPRGYLVVLIATIYPGIYTGGGLLSQGHFQLMLKWLEQHTVNLMDDKHGNGMLCFVVVLSSVASEFRLCIYPYSLGLLQWYCDKKW